MVLPERFLQGCRLSKSPAQQSLLGSQVDFKNMQNVEYIPLFLDRTPCMWKVSLFLCPRGTCRLGTCLESVLQPREGYQGRHCSTEEGLICVLLSWMSAVLANFLSCLFQIKPEVNLKKKIYPGLLGVPMRVWAEGGREWTVVSQDRANLCAEDVREDLPTEGMGWQ